MIGPPTGCGSWTGRQASQLVYSRLNPVAAGLVDHPDDMPSVNTTFGMWRTRYIEVERPPVYFDDNRPPILRLELTPPPLLYLEFDGDLDRLIFHLDKLTEQGTKELLAARTRPAMGAEGSKKIHPWSEPRTMRESGGRRVPTYRIGARGLFEEERDKEARAEVTAFRESHGVSRIAHRNGHHDVKFPFGTYAARAYRGAPVEPEPPDGALLAMPGLLLSDVEAILAERTRDRDAVREATHNLVDEVRETFVDEADVIVEETDLDFDAPAGPRRTPNITTEQGDSAPPDPSPDDTADDAGDTTTDDPPRPEPEVRHRFDRRRPRSGADAPRRLIVLRDRRRRRSPDDTQTKHGSDPPEE